MSTKRTVQLGWWHQCPPCRHKHCCHCLQHTQFPTTQCLQPLFGQLKSLEQTQLTPPMYSTPTWFSLLHGGTQSLCTTRPQPLPPSFSPIVSAATSFWSTLKACTNPHCQDSPPTGDHPHHVPCSPQHATHPCSTCWGHLAPSIHKTPQWTQPKTPTASYSPHIHCPVPLWHCITDSSGTRILCIWSKSFTLALESMEAFSMEDVTRITFEGGDM